MDTAQKIPIIKRVKNCIPGGNWSAVSRALFLAEEGRRVMLVTSATYLCEDICDSLLYYLEELPADLYERVKELEQIHDGYKLHPDRFKRYLEELCDTNSIEIIYNARVVDFFPIEEGNLVRIGGKFGLAGIIAETYHQDLNGITTTHKAGEDRKNKLIYRSFVSEEQNSEQYELLELSVDLVSENKNLYRDVYSLKKQLMDLYKQKKQKHSNLRLGRFALKPIIWNSKELIFGEETTEWEQNSAQEVSVIAHNIFINWGKYPLREVSRPVKGIKKQYELVVVGGGTSGAMAALHGARMGLKTVLIEPNSMLGGTGSVGGVSTYWFGKRFKPVLEIDEEIGKIKKELTLTGRKGIWSESDDSHPNIRDYVLAEKCLEAGVEIVLEHIAYGMCRDEQGRLGVATSGTKGSQFFYGDYVFDATGDGDLAAFLNAKIIYGSNRDCITYWGSLAQYTSTDTYKNNFSSMVLCGDPLDYTEFIKLGRKRGGGVFDHGSYVSMRESRHIQGEKILDLRDWLNFSDYEDAIYTCYSNYDPKGKLDADIIYQGILPQQSEALVPLRALCPLDNLGERICGLYVLGKAISATHNVFPGLRMQPDLMHQGAVMGILAGLSKKRGRSIEALSPLERKEWIREMTGDPLMLKPSGDGGNHTVKEHCMEIKGVQRTHWVDVDFTYEEIEKNKLIGLYLEDGKIALPFLEEKWEEVLESPNKEYKRQLAHLLLWHGSSKSREYVFDLLKEELRESLPEREGSVMCAQLLPDHGVMPETVYSLNTLCNVTDIRIMEHFERVVEYLLKAKRDYQDIRKGIYHYIESVAYVAERTGFKEFETLLVKLLELEEFHDIYSKSKQEEILTERLQILYFILARALARLGNHTGYMRLINVISQATLSIRYSAVMELEELLQVECGMNVEKLTYEVKNNPLAQKVQRIQERKW